MNNKSNHGSDTYENHVMKHHSSRGHSLSMKSRFHRAIVNEKYEMYTECFFKKYGRVDVDFHQHLARDFHERNNKGSQLNKFNFFSHKRYLSDRR
jgi:hypothetical protein